MPHRVPAMPPAPIVLVLTLSLLLGACGGVRVQEQGAADDDTAAAAEDPFAGDDFFDEDDVFADEEDFAPAPTNDPLESFNRKVFSFNTQLDKYLLKPVAKGYRKVTPRPARTVLRNFVNNLREPLWALNSLLQGRGGRASRSMLRFLVNSTLGLGGLFDPAGRFFNLPQHKEDFGQTLARWGVPPGPYVMLPLFGPRNLRDAGGDLPTLLHDPNQYVIPDSKTRTALSVAGGLETRISLLGLDPLLANELDPYLFVREGYRQNRQQQVLDRGERPPEP